MPEIEIDNLASVGGIVDVPAYQTPPEAWSFNNNVRYFANGVEKLKGWSSRFNSPVAQSPNFILYVSAPAQPFWLWASPTDIWVWDGTSNTKISKTPGAYTAPNLPQWNGTIIGGVPVMNNGTDPPQFWAKYDSITPQLMADLTNWGTHPDHPVTCKVIRSFLVYLLALNITGSGGVSPHEVRWSNEAQPGSLPTTWDFGDPTHNAGRVFLGDVDSGQIMDGQELGGQFFVYKENSVWRFVFVGGTYIFQDQVFLETAGLLTANCVALTGDGLKHVFLSQDDLVLHNGFVAEPLLNRRYKRYLFNQLHPTAYVNSFLLSNPPYEEIWVCYPSSGAPVNADGTIPPNRALIWNYRYNAISEADISFTRGAIGTFVASPGTKWVDATIPWNSDIDPWSTQFRRKVIVCDHTNKQFYMLDDTPLRNGVNFNGILQRLDLGVLGRTRQGEWIEDFQHRKMIQNLWPKVVAPSPIQIQVGYQDTPNGPIRWNAPVTFDPNTQIKVDGTFGQGRSIALQFSSLADFRLDGYKMDLAIAGKF